MLWKWPLLPIPLQFNLTKAAALLDAASWKLGPDGRR